MRIGRFEYLAKLALPAGIYYLTGKFGNSIAWVEFPCVSPDKIRMRVS